MSSLCTSTINQSIVVGFNSVTALVTVAASSSLVAISAGCCTVLLLTWNYGCCKDGLVVMVDGVSLI